MLLTAIFVATPLVACSSFKQPARATSPQSPVRPPIQNLAANPGTWSNITPPVISLDFNRPGNNYGINTVVVDPRKRSTVYIGTCYQGLWESTDGGNSWLKVNTGRGGNLLDSGRLWALTIDSTIPRILYTTAGYGVGGILKSTDGGISWEQVFAASSPLARKIGTNDIYSIAIDPTNHNHLLAAFHSPWYGNQDSGLIQSSNAGRSWQIVKPVQGWGWGNAVWFVKNSRTWLVGTQSDGIWRTADRGQTWKKVYTQNVSHGGINSLARTTSGTLILGIWTQVIESTDDGTSWQDITSGLPYAAYETVGIDGKSLYTAPSFPEFTNSQATAWYERPVGGGSWRAVGSAPCASGSCNGPVMMASDATHHIVYAANWDAGLWKLRPSPNSQEADQLGSPLVTAHGVGPRVTYAFRTPPSWTLTWTYQGSTRRTKAAFTLTIYRSGDHSVLDSLTQLGYHGGGHQSYSASGIFYVQVRSTGSWNLVARS